MSKVNNYNYVSACSDAASNASAYTLLNRQEPIHARISTNNERDRRPIDPPPIIQMRLNNATPQQTDAFHQNSYFYMCANLAHPSDDSEIYTPTHNALSGQTVSSMYKLKDIDNHDGAFFVFGDLSVKVEGSFRLKLSLFEITTTGAVCLQSIFTGPFMVYPTKKFPGMLDSTFLSRSFSDQGARIRIRKENRAQVPNNNIAAATSVGAMSRKRKLEIQTEQYILCAPSPTSTSLPAACYNASPNQTMAQSPPLPATNVPGSYYERRASITSSGTESCSSDESPIATHFSSPRVSLPPLSPPQQSYDKFFPIATSNYIPLSYHSSPSSPPLHAHHQMPVHAKLDFDASVKLPPIRNFISSLKRQRTTSTEQDAVVAMMQLSHSYNTSLTKKHHLLHLN
ncbi:VosA [Mucor ambiguus]|uniref:VosA n=1 Tax=Mucor ambiguus TaxID=91626 RepID=A0A0C9MF43_9FUNG|nr:VosA [Mucor ambiguus]